MGGKKPKTLTKIIGKKSILDLQVEKLAKQIGLENIIIVLGYKKELIMDKFPNLTFIYNKEYASTSTSKSWFAALQKIDDDVLLIDGDVYFDERVLPLLFKNRQSCLLVDKKICKKPDSKFNLNNKGFINEISKSLINYVGESIGLRLISKKDLPILREHVKNADKKDFGDIVLSRLTKNNRIKLKPIFVGNYFCKQMNTKIHLQTVKKFIKKNKLSS